MKKAAVLQSNYIPWKGYFDIINSVDLFVFYDEVQYTKCDWRNRNQICTKNGLQWLSIPVSSSRTDIISDVNITETKWKKQHFNALRTNYGKAPYFKKYQEFLEYVYLDTEWNNLSQLNRFLIEEISSNFLNCNTKFDISTNYDSTGSKHEKLFSLVESIGPETYLSGPAAKDYLKVQDYENVNIKVEWMDYSQYPVYEQISMPQGFSHYVSIFDMLFMLGENTAEFIWGNVNK